jgi:hypothetical protein
MHLTVERNSVEQRQIAKWPVKLSPQNRQKIDHLPRRVIEVNANGVRRNDFEAFNTADQMFHKAKFYFNGSMGAALRPECSKAQSAINSS